jgi:hypothetical protein
VVRVVLINKDTTNGHNVLLTLPGTPPTASLETMSAPGASATSGVTLGGQTFGAETSTGVLPGPSQTTPVSPVAGAYPVTLGPGSATMLTAG